MPNYSRKHSNDLAASLRLAELRELQSQLSSVMQDENDEVSSSVLDSSIHSTASLPGLEPSSKRDSVGNIRRLSRSRSLSKEGPRRTTTTQQCPRRISNDLAACRPLAELRLLQRQLSSVIQDENDEASSSGLDTSVHSSSASQIVDARISHGTDSEYDVESGGMPSVYKPFQNGSNKNVTQVTSSQTLVTMTCHSSTTDETKSEISSSNINQSDSSAAANINPVEPKLPRWRRNWISRSKTFSRSKSRDRSKSNDSRLSVSRRSSILTQMRSKKESSIDDVEKQSLTGQLPNYDFLTDSDKERGSLKAGHHWWHGVFILSLVSMVACIITLWAPYPIGARMSSSEIAKMPWSNGCIGVETCICPRETICADDLLSMIFLTIARASAWFGYPLYMLLFLSKCSNLNNFLQTTAARCWVNFSDSHKVHSLFGCIVAIETTSHSFFHLLRWARRSNDIQLLWTTKTGITGLIAFSLTPLIALPMAVPFLKKRMKFEWRKGKSLRHRCTYVCNLCFT